MVKKYRYAPATPCTQAIIFARVSSEEQKKGASIDAQLQSVINYCRSHNFKILETFSIVESSTNGGRKKFYEMLDYVKSQTHKTAIVVYCIDRFQRRFNECVEVEEILFDDKTDLHFYKEGLILTKNSSASDIMRWDMGVFSGKMYVANLRDNVNRSMTYNWSIGKYQTKAPIGYLNVPGTKTKPSDIIIDEDRAPLMVQMYKIKENNL